MLESKNYYFPQDENRKPAKGYSATIVFQNDNNVNRGCTGFSNKMAAERYLKIALARISSGEDWKGYILAKAIIEKITK